MKQTFSKQQLLEQYDKVYRYALSLCKNEALAEDLAQETFLKALKKENQFTQASSLFTWLCAITKHLYLDELKRRKPVDSPIETFELADETVSIELRLGNHEQALQVHRYLHTLAEPYKEVFSLRVFGELSFADIAHLFEKSEGWARVTFYRAKQKLIEEIRKDGNL